MSSRGFRHCPANEARLADFLGCHQEQTNGGITRYEAAWTAAPERAPLRRWQSLSPARDAGQPGDSSSGPVGWGHDQLIITYARWGALLATSVPSKLCQPLASETFCSSGVRRAQRSASAVPEALGRHRCQRFLLLGSVEAVPVLICRGPVVWPDSTIVQTSLRLPLSSFTRKQCSWQKPQTGAPKTPVCKPLLPLVSAQPSWAGAGVRGVCLSLWASDFSTNQ